MELRPLGNTGILVSPVAFGAWPIAGLTSAGTNDEDSIATIRACFELGINHIDTAYCYGRDGESERLVARALGTRRSEMVIATKGGLHWDAEGKQAHDASPAMLRRECEESLRRLETDYVDLYYLHAPDPKVPVAESAAALRKLMEEGKTRSVGVSNVTVAQLEEFAAVCPIAAYQPPYNMLQRQIEADTLPWCRRPNAAVGWGAAPATGGPWRNRRHGAGAAPQPTAAPQPSSTSSFSHDFGVAVLVYWPLMKGLLAGKLRRDQSFAHDSRRKYPMFQGEEYQKNLDLVEKLRAIAASSTGILPVGQVANLPPFPSGETPVGQVANLPHTVAQLVVNWTIHQPGVTAALCGAKRPEQLRETAGAAGWQLTPDQLARVDQALAERGTPITKAPV
jgi:aryl-alcohol dehydrogenase-like predicted oxidoreductase